MLSARLLACPPGLCTCGAEEACWLCTASGRELSRHLFWQQELLSFGRCWGGERASSIIMRRVEFVDFMDHVCCDQKTIHEFTRIDTDPASRILSASKRPNWRSRRFSKQPELPILASRFQINLLAFARRLTGVIRDHSPAGCRHPNGKIFNPVNPVYVVCSDARARFLWLDCDAFKALQPHEPGPGFFRFRNKLALCVADIDLRILFRLREVGCQLRRFNQCAW